MADSMESNAGSNSTSQERGKPPDVNAMFDQYLNEAASHPKYANREKSDLISKENKTFLENWEKEIDKIPAFMSEVPKDLDSEENSLIAALQAIKYDEDDPPEAICCTYFVLWCLLEQAKVHKDDGNQWFKKKKYKTAIAAYNEALKQKFEDNDLRAVLYTNRAAANFHLGNLRSSLNDATEAIKHKPDHLKALVRGAECCMKLEKYDEAVTWCDDALKVAADDRRVLELRSSAIKQQKLTERNKRKQKAEEKAINATRMKIVEIIKSRNVKFGQPQGSSNVKSQEQLMLEAVASKHPSGASISLDESGRLLWPVTFLYPEYGQSDFIQAFHEDSIFSDHLEVLFEEMAPWDVEKVYKPHNLQVYFHHSEASQLVEINHEFTLRMALQDPRYLVAGDLVFVILPKGTPFTKNYLERYESLQ